MSKFKVKPGVYVYNESGTSPESESMRRTARDFVNNARESLAGKQIRLKENPMTIFDEIRAERELQKEKWGGAEHDDRHSAWDWIVFITKHNGMAMEPGSQEHFNIREYRHQMIRVAALAVAAIEWCDRNFDESPSQD